MNLIKKSSYFIFIFIFSIGKCANGQDTLVFNSIIFKVAPLSFMDFFSFPSTQAGFEFRFTPKVAIDFSYGQIFGEDAYNRVLATGFKSKFEIRNYLRPNRIRRGKSYLAVEGYYNQISYSPTSTFTYRGLVYTYAESYRIEKKIYGVNFKYGFTVNLSQRFVFNVYGGVGIRTKNVKHTERSRPEDKFSCLLNIKNMIDKPGEPTVPNLTIGFKFGYILKKKSLIIR